MNKHTFAATLRNRLSGLPREDIERSIEFYCELIDDRMEEGLTEEEAISEIGSIEEVVSQIMSEIPLSRLVKEKVRPKRALSVWVIVLLVLGAPIWLSLLISVFAIVISLYIVIWAVMISLWAVDFAVAGCSVGGILSLVPFAFQGNALTGIAMLGAGLVCGGISILFFFCCQQATKGVIWLTKKMASGIKALFIRKGDAK